MRDVISSSISRRTFLKCAAAGVGGAVLLPGVAACASASAQEAPEKYYRQWRGYEPLPDDQKLGIALVGLGGYAQGQLAPALQKTKFCRLRGLVSGTPAKLERLGQQYGIPEANRYSYDTFDRIADNPDIDIVYIVLPNGLHAEYTIRAAEAGKHIICEKPMATTVADAQAMVEAARANQVQLSVGYRLHFEPFNQHAMWLGQQQVLGALQSMDSANGFTLTNGSTWRTDKTLAGGGPLMDMGIYAVQAAIYTMGALPLSVSAETETTNTDLFSEVEETIRWTLHFPDDVQARGRSSYSENVSRHRATASDGWLELTTAFYYGGQSGATSRGPMDFPQVHEQVFQIDDVARNLRTNTASRVPGTMGLRDVRILMALYESANSGQPVSFNWDDDVPLDLSMP